MDDVPKPPSPLPADDTGKIQRRGRPFEPGQSGNPAGRPKGSRNKMTLMAEQLLDASGEQIVALVIQRALAGDPSAMNLCFGRLVPKRERAVTFDLPPIDTPQDLRTASAAVVQHCQDGTLSPHEAVKVMAVISSRAQALGWADQYDRVAEIEQKLEGL
jgi:hypothetical protein